MIRWCLFLLSLRVHAQHYGDPSSSNAPQVKIVNAMCTANGITASIAFDRPFSGIIYSMGHGNTHECVYYNAILTENILFSIPNDRCGTRHDTHELLETIENRVYVQVDKLTQTGADKQYAFVCHSPSSVLSGNEIRRHPTATPKPIVPVVGAGRFSFHLIAGLSDNRPLGGWGTPIFPTSAFRPFETHSNSFPFQESRNSPSDAFYSRTSFPIPRRSFSTHELENSVVDSKPELLANKATTRAYGNRSSWSIVRTDAPEVIDDFSSGPSSKPNVDSDADLLRVAGEKQMKATTTSSSAEDRQSTTLSPIIAPQSANSIDTAALEPDAKLFATQRFDKLTESVRLEIQRGEGPFNQSISSAVKIGDTITLTVQGRAASRDQKQFNMFVHSCYATDENNTVKVNLIDSSGCSIHSQVLRPMQRLRINENIIYFFPLKAFKFPGPSEVFFYCSIDISPDYNFPELCGQLSRRTRESVKDQYLELFLSKNVTIQMPNSSTAQKVEGVPEFRPNNSRAIVGAVFGVSALLFAFISMIVYWKFNKKF